MQKWTANDFVKNKNSSSKNPKNVKNSKTVKNTKNTKFQWRKDNLDCVVNGLLITDKFGYLFILKTKYFFWIQNYKIFTKIILKMTLNKL